MDVQRGRGAKRLYAAVFHAPEPSWRGFLGDIGCLAIVGAGFGAYHRAWVLLVAGVTVGAAALPVTVWLQGREPTDSEVELPPIGIHYLYPLCIIGGVALAAAIVAGDLSLAVIGTVVMTLSGLGLWLAWRRRRRFDG